MSINFKHPTSGLIKECPEGFSWTTFFFNGLVPLFRGMWGTFAIIFFTFGFAGYYYMFAINKIYATFLMEKGYTPASQIDIDKLKQMGVGLAPSETPTQSLVTESTHQIDEEEVAS